MSPRSLVHQSKKEALIHLCNFLCTRSVTSISDLADGEIFLETIQTKFPHYSNECPVVEVKPNEDNVDIDEKQVDESIENPEKTNSAKKNILLRYNYIQKFIDDKYRIESGDIICFNENMSELELFKVTSFVLSEIVKDLLNNNDKYLCTLFHLDLKLQIELEELFRLFISERKTITRLEVEKLLSKSAKKGKNDSQRQKKKCSVYVSPFGTPRKASLRNKDKNSDSPSPTTAKEDIFSNSPLKVYFESPVFKKEEILLREKRIKNLEKNIEKIVDEQDEETSAYIRKINEMEKELKKKEILEKDNKELQNKIDELISENEDLKTSLERMKENYCTDKNTWNSETKYLTNQVIELCNKLNDVQMTKEKERSLYEANKSLSQSSQLNVESASESPDKLEPLKTEIVFLRERVKSLELKTFAYKKQLSQKLLTELKQKNPPGNLNQSYEDIWSELDKERKGEEETMASIIVEDNRALNRKLNEARLLNKELNEEIERLKKKAVSNNKSSVQRKRVCSVATMTVELNVPEMKDISKISEAERLRRSLNQSKSYEHCNLPNEPSYVFNNSDNLIPSEQSVMSTETEMSQCSEQLPEAVLWKMYDSPNPEIETAHGITLSHNVTENSYLPVINNVGVSNIKIGNTESDSIPTQENKYVLGNLNFDVFLNELKKLTKNGSFQKVLQVFGKLQKKINGTNRSSRLDLQEMLKMITECVCTAVTLNAESAFANHQDKCCSTDETEFFTIDQNYELEKLKNELSSISQKHERELKERKKMFDELMQEKNLAELRCQACNQKISQLTKKINEMYGEGEEEKIKMGNLSKKYAELKKAYNKQLDITQKYFAANKEMQRRQRYLFKRSQQYENHCKVLKKENNHLKEELKKLKEEKEKEIKSVAPAVCSRDSYIGVSNHFSTKSELHCSTFQDTANESTLSGAFHKNISHYVSENEDDFFNINSLNSIKKEYENERIEELKRRNSFLPFHLQTSYPVEADLQATYESLYVKDGEKSKEEQLSKKRKLEDPEESSVTSIIQTPVTKLKRKMETPKSLQRFIKTIKYNNNKWFPSKQSGFPVKPKGS